MRVLHTLDEATGQFVHPVVTAGNFDGVHLGHRAIIEEAVAQARQHGCDCLLVTFEPHPQLVIGRRPPLPLLTTLDEKLSLLAHFPITAVLVIPFTQAVAQTEPETYVRQVYAERLRVRELVVGYSHAFGRHGAGTTDLLRTMGMRYGFQVRVVPPVRMDGEVVNSTRIRELIAAGRVRDAARLLGHPYALTGRVIHGEGRGRQIKFPTANLQVSAPQKLIPAQGVYAVRTRIEGQWWQGVMNIGVRPTFGAGGVSSEVHLLDFQGDLYDHDLDIEIVERLRAEQRFSTVEALQAQITADVAHARQVLQALGH